MATIKELTVYQALIEISRINDMIDKQKRREVNYYVSAAPENSQKISGFNRSEAEDILKSVYDSMNHLILNLASYKGAVALSNATTKVKINGKEYTVAEAIQKKANFDTEMSFYNDIRNNITSVKNYIEKENRKIENGLESYLEKVKTENTTPEEIEKLTDKYYLDRKLVMVDPYKLATTIDKKIEDLTKFMNEVDNALTYSNCVTTIAVELED